MKYRTRLAIAVAALALPAVALAQDPAAPPAEASATAVVAEAPAAAPAPAETPAGPPPCELHVWPAERMSSMTTGLLGGGLLDAAIHAGTDSSNRAQLASALDSPTQLDALQSLDLVTQLGLPAGTVSVRHETPLERHTMNRIKTRRSDSAAACYYELITADVFYQKAAIYGRSLRTLFMLRAFGNDQEIDFEYKAWGGNGLSHFPPREGEDVTVGLTELVDVFKRNFEEYANNERQALATYNQRQSRRRR